MRTIVTNEIRGLIRKVKRRPMMETLSDRVESRDADARSKLASGATSTSEYERALPKLSPEQAEAIVLFEMGFSNREIARILGLEHANAARMRVSRAILRLSKLLGRSRE
jgi:DNA-directed RNA polymerase specialized sigma24 family protein